MRDKLKTTLAYIKGRTSFKPEILLILGSGMGRVALGVDIQTSLSYENIPYFKKTGVPTHKGKLVFGTLGKKKLMVMQGRWHLYEGYTPQEVAYPVMVAHALGAKTLIATNLAGGINKDFKIGDFMAVTDHINLSGDNPLAGLRNNKGKIIFQDMLNAYSPALRKRLRRAAASTGKKVHCGTLAFLKGPSFETPAELRFLKKIGADCVGWSVVPEVIAARGLGMEALGISCISDLVHPGNMSPVDLAGIFDAGTHASADLYVLLKKLCDISP